MLPDLLLQLPFFLPNIYLGKISYRNIDCQLELALFACDIKAQELFLL